MLRENHRDKVVGSKNGKRLMKLSTSGTSSLFRYVLTSSRATDEETMGCHEKPFICLPCLPFRWTCLAWPRFGLRILHDRAARTMCARRRPGFAWLSGSTGLSVPGGDASRDAE